MLERTFENEDEIAPLASKQDGHEELDNPFEDQEKTLLSHSTELYPRKRNSCIFFARLQITLRRVNPPFKRRLEPRARSPILRRCLASSALSGWFSDGRQRESCHTWMATLVAGGKRRVLSSSSHCLSCPHGFHRSPNLSPLHQLHRSSALPISLVQTSSTQRTAKG